MKNILILLSFLFLFENCAPSQAEDPVTTRANTTDVEAQDKSENNAYSYHLASKFVLPDSLAFASDIVVSVLDEVFIRDKEMVYVYSAQKDYTEHSLIKTIKLIDSNGDPLSNIGAMDYDDESLKLFVLTDESVFFYNSDGNYEGELAKPSKEFKPKDIAFDGKNKGIYVSSLATQAGELFYWSSLRAAPLSILKGKPFELEVATIATAPSGYNKSVYLLSTGGQIHCYTEYEQEWKITMTIGANNNIKLPHALYPQMRSDFVYLYLLTEKSIIYFKTQAGESEEDLYVGEISVPFEEVKENSKASETIINNYSFAGTNKMYILANGTVVIYEKN